MTTPCDTLNQTFGYAQFRGRQRDAIDLVNSGQHALVIMPTGMGKSLCYQIPALMQSRAPADQAEPLTVVLSPLIALMKDQVDALTDRGVDAIYINSSLSSEERRSRYRTISEGQHRLLYVTPERFRKPDFCQVIRRRNVRLLAVDEAHCISDWGHDFRPDYSRVAEWRELMEHPPTIALTATATPEVQRDIVRQLGLNGNEVTIIHEGIHRPNLRMTVEATTSDDVKLDEIEKVIGCPDLQRGAGIVYFTLIKTLERFSSEFASRQVPHVCYHGDLERRERRRIQNVFMSGECPLVLATNAFGMGIDKEDIRFVIHAELPGSMEAYYQEIGRAGRDGRPSQCTLLYDERDLMSQMEFIDWKNPDAAFYQHVYDKLTQDSERVHAFGHEWLNKQLQCKSKYDHRLDTALAILDRHGVVRGPRPPECWDVVSELPESFKDSDGLSQKRLRDQKKLYSLVQYVKHVEKDDQPMDFINDYFGIA